METQRQGRLRLAGKTAIITGASGGIGAEIVRLFVEEGAKVIAIDASAPQAAATEASVHFRQLDISSEAEVRSFFEALTKDDVQIDILVNNAGIILGKPLIETTVEEWDRLAAVNGRGTFLMIRGVMPLINPEEGSVVNVSSASALRPMKNLSAYAASKAAVNALTKAAANELAPVRFNVVCPGVIDTPMPRKSLEGLNDADRDKAFSAFSAGRALGRIGRPEEIAEVVLFLASPEASYVTGVEFNIDGGKQ